MRQAIAEMQPQMLPNGNGKTSLLITGTNAFRKYVEKHKSLRKDEKNIVAVLRTKKGDDFAFTLSCLLNCNGCEQTEYDEVDAFEEFYDKCGTKLEDSGVSFDALNELCNMLDEYAKRLCRQGELIEIEAARKRKFKETRRAIAGGAAVGAVLFGIPGAVIGGAVSKAIKIISKKYGIQIHMIDVR